MPSGILINEHTLAALTRFAGQPSHALLLQGEEGYGLRTLANHTQVLLKASGHDASLVYTLEPQEKSTITIEQVRELRTVFKHKVSHSNSTVHAVIIVDAIEKMQQEAQNALLKHLEEPPVGVLFIILCHDPSRMLQTIVSRCVVVHVLPVSKANAIAYFAISEQAIAKPYAISGGAPSLLVQLVSKEDHPLLKDIDDAKQILRSTVYQRLISVDTSYKSAEQAVRIVTGLEKVCKAGLKSGSKTSEWLHNNLLLQDARKKLEAHVQAKLVIDELFMSLK